MVDPRSFSLIRKTGIFIFFACSLRLLTCPSVALAEGTESDLNSEISTRHANGGFFELGIIVEGERRIRHRLNPAESDDYQLGIGLDVSAGYRYKRLFFEATRSSFGGLNAGITLTKGKHWDVDLLLANISGTATYTSDEPLEPVTESDRNRAILDRDSLYVAAGGRLSGYFGDNLFQLSIVSDWLDGNGILGSLRAGRQWQLGNWNANAIAGVRYYSQTFNDYQFGVDVDEQSERFPAYKAGIAWIPEVEFGLSLPVRENWVYSSRVRYTQFPSSVVDSPLVNRKEALSVSTGIHYVF